MMESAHTLVLLRLRGGPGDENLEERELEASGRQPSPLTFAAWRLVSASLCHELDGLGVLRASSGGPDVLACTASYATTEGYEFLVCCAALGAMTLSSGKGHFSILDAESAHSLESQLQPGCRVRSVDCAGLAQALRVTSQSAVLRHVVMFR